MVPFTCERQHEGNSACARPCEGEGTCARSGTRAGTHEQDSMWGMAKVRVRKREVTYMREAMHVRWHVCKTACMRDSACVRWCARETARARAREGERVSEREGQGHVRGRKHISEMV